jgi:hypothetical protein
MLENSVLTLAPNAVIAAMAAIAIRATTSEYSTNVAALSSSKTSKNGRMSTPPGQTVTKSESHRHSLQCPKRSVAAAPAAESDGDHITVGGYEPPTVVVVTLIVSVAVWVPSLTVKVQPPFDTGVTVNVFGELDGEIVAMPLHELVVPVAGVVTVKVPEKPVSVALNVCAAPLPVAMNERVGGVSTMELGFGVAVGVGLGVGVGVGVAVGFGVGVAVGVGLGVGDALDRGVGEGVGLAVGVGPKVGEAVGLGVGPVGTLVAEPPEPLHAATAAAATRNAHAAPLRAATAARRDHERSGPAVSP